MSAAQVVFCTVPDAERAADLARTLVSEALCACVNIVPGVRSIYHYDGEVCDDAEVLMVIKTTASGASALQARIVALHPYDVPEFLALDVASGYPPYLAWLASSMARDT